MGKKVKKDEKAPPEDVTPNAYGGPMFETLLVESKHAATVVLMLASPEDDVQSKACEAIYKFVEKCDENKKMLLDLEAIDPLLNLIESEEKMVRRHAIMAVGVMCAHPDVRKAIRKRPDAITAIIELLNPDEDSVTHEFGALSMSLLATEFVGKVAIQESNGVEPLIKLLSSTDPDVQKNSIEAICQLVLDYEARASVREVDGLSPILELLKSEYAIIQRLALLSLDRLSEDAENRRVLREIDAIAKLLDVLSQPLLSDLHVMVVMTLSNLLEDTESLEMIRENGGLKRFVSLITDQPQPEEEAKKSEKKGGSGTGKKSASTKGEKEDDKDDTPTGGDSVIPTLPDVKMCAAKAIARSARNAINRKLLHEQEAEKMLIQLLYHDTPDVQAAAAQALAVICENVSAREAIMEWDGLPPLVKLLGSDNGEVKEAASLAIANLTCGNGSNCIEFCNLGGLDVLISCLKDVREEVLANAACALTNMTQEEKLRNEAESKGVITALIEPLLSNNPNVQAKVALAVSAYCVDAESRKEFREHGGLDPLVLLLHSGNDTVRRNAAWAINVCGVDEPTATEICKLGGLQILQEIQGSSSRNNAFVEAALQRLLDSNLSAKFSLYSYLGPGNLIEDGFFDCGKLKQGTTFKSLEEFCREEMNNKRPILLVNAAKPVASEDVTESSKNEDGEKHDSSRIRDSTSRGKAEDLKGKARAQKEKEEKAKEEEAEKQKEAESTPIDKASFVPPPDPALVKYIEEVTDRILPLPSTKAQVFSLADFVCEKMGGPIIRGQVANFSWELPLNQVRFELKSNVIPIGKMTAGIHIHRALLFKALADRIALPCSLTRGEYNRAWNEILLPDDGDDVPKDFYAAPFSPSVSSHTVGMMNKPVAPKFPPKKFIVDLVHDPGCLLTPDTQAAVSYMKL